MSAVPGARPRHRTVRGRAGYTLVELLVVMLVVGILAGLALPRVRSALHRADATRIVTDVNTIEQAAVAHLTETGAFPSSGGVGAVPDEMEDRLPEGFSFEYKGVRYRWSSFALPSHAGTNAFWTQSIMLFVIPG